MRFRVEVYDEDGTILHQLDILDGVVFSVDHQPIVDSIGDHCFGYSFAAKVVRNQSQVTIQPDQVTIQPDQVI